MIRLSALVSQQKIQKSTSLSEETQLGNLIKNKKEHFKKSTS